MQQTEAEYGGYDPEEEQHADGAHRIQDDAWGRENPRA